MTLSVAIITLNEEDCLGKTLDSIHEIADEIIIVDSCSTDRTEEISRSCSKVKFFTQEFLGFGLQKQSAVDRCSGRWILSIDADEIVTKELADSIKSVINNGSSEIEAYAIRRFNFLKNKRIRFGGWNKDRFVRLFTKSSGQFTPLAVHEYWDTNYEVGKLKGHLVHSPYKSMWHHIDKYNNYSSAKAKIKYDSGRRPSFLMVIIAPAFQFVQMYIFRLGFLDGKNGLYLAIMTYYYVFAKYYKLYNLSRNQN